MTGGGVSGGGGGGGVAKGGGGVYAGGGAFSSITSASYPKSKTRASGLGVANHRGDGLRVLADGNQRGESRKLGAGRRVDDLWLQPQLAWLRAYGISTSRRESSCGRVCSLEITKRK